jgi:4-amino-4-deoxy-L-arabinose transferase-like glycosyltransferase
MIVKRTAWTMSETRRTNRWLLTIILAGAALLRLYYINQPFVDVAGFREADDATIADNFFRGHLNIFLPEISWNGPGPNYVGYEFQLTTYVAALLYRLFGEVDWIGRGISVAFGVWGIFAFHNLVRRAFNGRRALVSSALLAVMPGAVFVDRSFIPDPVMLSLVITSLWILLVYLQEGRTKYLASAVVTAIFGLLTKISGLIVGVPVIYVILSSLPVDGRMRLRYLVRLITASTLVLTPVIGYYAWALHVSHAYPPYHVAARGNWVWNTGVESWLKAHYFWRRLYFDAKQLWGTPLLASALVGLLFPSAQAEASNQLRWLFHWWFLAGIIFYAFGAQELVINLWNLNIVHPALVGLAAQGLLVAASAFARIGLPVMGRAAIIGFVLAVPALEMTHLRWLYAPYAYQGYELGAALARISQPSDLVVTVAHSNDPVAIYYSGRRGWLFPPAWSGYGINIEDEAAEIELFDRLRLYGVQWFGIVAEEKKKLGETAPRLLAHIESTTKLADEDRNWAIYRVLPPSK